MFTRFFVRSRHSSDSWVLRIWQESVKGAGLWAKTIVYAEDIKKNCLEEGGALGEMMVC